VTDDIALFIDFENIRYSLINVQHREPDPQELIGLARRFGTVMVARAYADWSRQPEFFKGSLTAAMIDRVDCPAKVRERFRQNPGAPAYSQQSQYAPSQINEDDDLAEQDYDDAEAEGMDVEDMRGGSRIETVTERAEISADNGDEEIEAVTVREETDQYEDRRARIETPMYSNGHGYYQNPQPVITQSTVDLNMLMDIIETVFDRPSISTFILMSGDRDFTRICARLKLRLNKRVIVVGVPGTVSRDLISAAEQFIPLGYSSGPLHPGTYHANVPQHLGFAPVAGPVEPEEPGFIQFLDYIDRHWSWRTVGGVANFIGDPFNPKNRFRGRLTRESARDLLRICIDDGILIVTTDVTGSENLRLNRSHPTVESVLNETALR
jgi:uncharacterized LabA/DUF88 family protein